MIAYLQGRLEEKQPTRVILDVAGVGYEVNIPLSSYDALPAEGQEVRLLIYDHLRENAHELYGFAGPPERELFVHLLAINGIGPRIALAALSGLPVREIKRAVLDGDSGRLTSISGIGRKMAERIILDLRDRIGEAERAALGSGEAGNQPRAGDAVSALIALGYKQSDAVKRVLRASKQAPADAAVEDLVRGALKG